MQGFNKYYPPDYDGEKHKSLNSYRGKHALGDRARKIDQGILITRFELPYNIWCGTCNAHIGMGVRYNAEKKKIGNYYSTPIYSFRCKCHLCSGWFEIQTDPKNTRYIVVAGARKKEEDWNPEENGGFAVHDSNANDSPADPLASLEKTTTAEHNLTQVQAPRLSSLSEVSDRYNADPYALSVRVRKRFREVKKVEKAKEAADDAVRGKYALPETLGLVEEDAELKEIASQEWARAKREHDADVSAKRRRLAAEIINVPSASSSSSTRATIRSKPSKVSTVDAASALRARVLQNTARRSDPFSVARSKPPDVLGVTVKR